MERDGIGSAMAGHVVNGQPLELFVYDEAYRAQPQYADIWRIF